MRRNVNGPALRDLDRLLQGGLPTSRDGDLLDLFLVHKDEEAFEALVNRHGPMVLRVCRRHLTSAHDADDAFQATFLVLARKASRLRDPDRLGPWLHGVARRVASKARVRAARHQHESLVEVGDRENDGADRSDVGPILVAELGRLPARHRDVLAICLLEGASPDDAARRLGCPVGTVKSRLARGRETLRARLIRRGVVPAVAAWAVRPATASPLSPGLIRATLTTIVAPTISPAIAHLLRGANPSMSPRFFAYASALIGGLALTGLGLVTRGQPAAPQAPSAQPTTKLPHDRETRDHLRSILLANFNYENGYGVFTPAATRGKDGRPKLSWRVALLPYLLQDDLYREFRLDEPWDSPHNKALIPRMPAVFETPGNPAPPGETRIRGFSGAGSVFQGDRPPRVQDILDGTSNTLLLVVAADPTPWTKPGELPFVDGKPSSELAPPEPNGYPIGMLDGSVAWLPKRNLGLLPALITYDGRELFPMNSLLHPEPDPTTTPTGTPTPTQAPDLIPGRNPARASTPMPRPDGVPRSDAPARSEEIRMIRDRLDQVEAKLDRLLRRLDADRPETPR